MTFLSEADLLYCSEEFKAHITAATAADLLAQQGDLAFLSTPVDLIVWLTEQAGDPVAQPEGEDEPLCTICYQLCGIGGFAVTGPMLVNGYHEITLEDLNENYQKRPDDQAFCWLHALDASQAEQLGVAAAETPIDSCARDTEPVYPSWVSSDADPETCWISAEQLQESYAQGRRLKQTEHSIRIELGCGLDWDPRHDSEQFPDEEIEEGSLVFPDGHRPLLSIALVQKVNAVPIEMERLMPYLVKLAAVASTGKDG